MEILLLKEALPRFTNYLDQFKTAYLEHYFAAHHDSQKDLETWRPVIAAARLTERQQQDWLLEQVKSGLST